MVKHRVCIWSVSDTILCAYAIAPIDCTKDRWRQAAGPMNEDLVANRLIAVVWHANDNACAD